MILWLLREPVALWVFGSATHMAEVGWLGLGVLLTLISGSQTALLQGLRRIGDLARVQIISGMFGAITGVILVYALGQRGVVWFVLTTPAISLLVAGYYAARIQRPQPTHDWKAINQQWRLMFKLGLPFMATGMLGLATQLAARSMTVNELGLEAGGYFQAAWAISITYIGFVLGAMGADYYPRLSAAIHDHGAARIMVNEQTEMALLMAGPALLGMITFAPWVIQLLYSESFASVNDVLRWQVLGGILKVASWPMGYVLLAQGRGGIFIALEQIWNAIYIGAIYLGMEGWGIDITGMGFVISYAVYYGLITFVVFKLIDLRLVLKHLLSVSFLLIAGGSIIFAFSQSWFGGYVTG
ncbi:MAG: oligosaccharide flippase family protein, partial [Anaerolineales bacterium]